MDVVVLAVTKMHNGICVAGIDQRTGQWVRPVLDRQQWTSVYYPNGGLIEVGDVVRCVNPRLRPDPPHSEDVVVDQLDYQGTLSDKELKAFLDDHSEDEDALDSTLRAEGRSLCLIQVDGLRTVHGEHTKSTRLSFDFEGFTYRNHTQLPGYPCTDLVWRAHKGAGGSDPDSDIIYLGIGLARAFTNRDGRYVPEAPMVISVVTFPRVQADVDPDNL